MNYTVEKNVAKFSFEVSTDLFNKGLEYAYDQVKEKVEIKGFRKGKAPIAKYEQKFGVESLYVDALNFVVGQLFDQVLGLKELSVVSEPRDIDVDIDKIKRDEPFKIGFVVDLKPEVILGEYKGLKVAKQDLAVTDADVTVAIQGLLNKNKSMSPKDGAIVKGDTAIFDFKGSVDGEYFEGGTAENHSLEIGSGQFIPGFEDQMIGLVPGAEHDVIVKFPENYHAKHLAGKNAKFEIKVHEVKEPIAPTLNDEWVASLNIEGVKTVDELKAYEKNQLVVAKANNANRVLTNEAIGQAVANAQVDVPQSMIDREIKNYINQVTQQAQQYNLDLDTFIQLSGLTKEKFDQQATEQATRFVKQSLVIEAIAKKEALTATPDEIAAKYTELADHYQMPVEELKKYINDSLVTNDICFEKAVTLVVDNTVEE